MSQISSLFFLEAMARAFTDAMPDLAKAPLILDYMPKHGDLGLMASRELYLIASLRVNYRV